MNSPQFLFFVTAAIVVVSVGHSAAELLTDLVKAAEEEKYLASQGFQDLEDAIIMASTDKDSLVAKASIQAIRQIDLECKAKGVSSLAMDTAMEGILSALRLIAASGHRAYNTIDTALKLMAANHPEAAEIAIRKGIKSDIDMVFSAGVPIHDSSGSALALVGGAAQQGLKNAINFIQKAGLSSIETLEMAEEMALDALKAGGRAAEESLKAARETVTTGGITVYVDLYKAAQQTCEGLRYAAFLGLGPEEDLVPGIVKSLKTKASTDNPAALAAVARLENGLGSILMVSTKKSAIDAALILNQGLISTIVETADSMAVAKKALAKAGKIAASQGTQAAIDVVRMAFKVARDELAYDTADAFLGFGAAGQIAGKEATEGLTPAVIEVEHGRTISYLDFELAEQAAVIGLTAGGIAAAQGIVAAIQICEAAENAMYTQIAEGGEIGFGVLRNIR